MSLPESGLTTENANRRPSGDQSPSRVPDCTAAPFSRRDSRSFPRGKLVGLVVASRHGGGGSPKGEFERGASPQWVPALLARRGLFKTGREPRMRGEAGWSRSASGGGRLRARW